ncbi:hypothetical protein BDN71DRAFT_1433933 [Pleurotus eryngii]|uniref:Uncharacterized protein n=1 Tax=Pleurotus eryngii TaxID=5323 RepID=A0A9P6DDK9_PLEER|nr:hypothetical protein BDN71DRAFT_1433933 [Pleurotus eryngii]
MGHGQPHLYKTSKEKANANCAKSRCSYYKQKVALAPSHKGSNSWYRADKSKYEMVTWKLMCNRSGLLNDAAMDKEVMSTLVISLVTATGKHFDSFIKASLQHYFNLLCLQYKVNYQTEIFSDDLKEIRAFHAIMEQCNMAILQLAGVRKELCASQNRERQDQETLKCLEELECYTLIRKAEVIEMQHNHQLMYQSLPY